MEPLTEASKNGDRLRSLRGLDWLNFFLVDPLSGFGSFLPVFLASAHWDEQLVGAALGVGGIAGIISQIPAGAIVDDVRSKRALVALGVLSLSIGACLCALFPQFWLVVGVQVLIATTFSLVGPAVCAISLGIVGREKFGVRQGRNQLYNSLGKMIIAIAIGLLGYYISDRSVFFFIAFLAIPTLISLLFINPREIDYEMARGADERTISEPVTIGYLFHDPLLFIFLVCIVLFNFANAAMLPLLGERISRSDGQSSMMLMSIFVVVTQLAITFVATWSGKKAGLWGRKPLLLIAFGIMPLRALLYALTYSFEELIFIQLLDGIGAGIYGVVSTLVIADLTKGTGRFNLTLGAAGTAIGIGSAISQVVAGSIVKDFGYSLGFIFLACVAFVAFVILYFFMPETKNIRDEVSP